MFKLWKRERSVAPRATAKDEQVEARDACRRVFGDNVDLMLQDVGVLSNAILLGLDYDCQGANDLFLWGLLDAFMEGRPAMSTPPGDRLLLHMAAYLVEREEIALPEGIARAKSTQQRVNEDQPICNAFVEAGRSAYREGNEHSLLKTARRIQYRMIFERGLL